MQTTVAVPKKVVALYTAKQTQQSESSDLSQLAASWSNNSDDGFMEQCTELQVITECKLRSRSTCGLAGSSFSKDSSELPAHAARSAPTAPPKVRRLLIRELLNCKKKPSKEELNEEVSQRRTQVIRSRAGRRRPSVQVRSTFDNLAAQHEGISMSPTGNPDVPFMKLGMESKNMVQVADALSKALPVTITPMQLYDYPTLNSLVEHVRSVSTSENAASKYQSSAVWMPPDVNNEVAVVATNYALPGGIHSTPALAAALASASDKIGQVPHTRWDTQRWFTHDTDAGKIYVDQSGFLAPGVVQCFDHDYFGIRAGEVNRMDPQQRLLLHQATGALIQAQMSNLKAKPIAVYVGCSHHDWERVLMHANDASPYNTTGAATSVMAGRISFELGLTGPSMVVDTACSSSLVACRLGYEYVQANACTQAVVAGVNLLLDPMQTVLYCQTRMLSINGR